MVFAPRANILPAWSHRSSKTLLKLHIQMQLSCQKKKRETVPHQFLSQRFITAAQGGLAETTTLCLIISMHVEEAGLVVDLVALVALSSVLQQNVLNAVIPGFLSLLWQTITFLFESQLLINITHTLTPSSSLGESKAAAERTSWCAILTQWGSSLN